jgi:hypothetical protein
MRKYRRKGSNKKEKEKKWKVDEEE